jgi:hypothetical protein
MNKPIGFLIIGVGLIMIVIGIMGTQSQILADIKAVNPKLRKSTGTTAVAAPAATSTASNVTGSVTGGTAPASSGGTTG